LLLNGLDRHELHVRLRRRDAQCRRIGGIVLLTPFHERPRRLGCDQLHVVAEAGQLARPMVARPARLNHHRARLLLLKERQQLVPPELALQLCLSGLVHPVHLKHGLCRVQTDHGNAHRGRSFRFVSNDPDFGTSMPGAVHPVPSKDVWSAKV
jgi:hypothetical protein